MRMRVVVGLKAGVLDPQGKAIGHALDGLGFAGVRDVRAGKVIDLELEDGVTEAQVDEMCRRLLANPVMETYSVERL